MKIKIITLKLITALLLSTFLPGCGFIDRCLNNNKYSDYYAREDEKEAIKLVEKHQQSIGMSEEEIKMKYGKPEDVDYNVKHFTGEYDSVKEEWGYEKFDERWYYRFNTGIKYISGNLLGVYFYFKDNKLLKVDTR